MILFLTGDQDATLKREWFGLVCAFFWFFGSMISYYEPFFSGTIIELVFMLLLCAGLVGSALTAENHSETFEKALPAVTMLGAACTFLIPFLPVRAASLFFWLSALLMAPLLSRRLYGVLLLAREGMRMRAYISAVAVTIVIQMIWAIAPLPFSVKFPLLSLFAPAGLRGALSGLPRFERAALPRAERKKTPELTARMAAVFLLLVLLNIFNTLIHTHVLMGSLESDDLFSLAAWAVVPLSFLFYAHLSDKGMERVGFSVGLALILIGCFAALAPENGVFAAPLLVLGEFGGTITEFSFLTMPLLFFPFSARPRLAAVSGLVTHTLLASALSWTQDLWLPTILLSEQIERPLVIFGAVCALALIPLVFFVWRRQEDSTLMAALLNLRMRQEEQADTCSAEARSALLADAGGVASPVWTQPLDLVEGEFLVAQLLCEGRSRSEIAERLSLSSAKVSEHLRALRQKLESREPLGCSKEALFLAGQYSLTSREAEVLSELLLGRSNAEISANLHIEETTVKTHVGKVLKKTGVKNRSELIAKVRS